MSKKVIKLTEAKLNAIVKRVVKENDEYGDDMDSVAYTESIEDTMGNIDHARNTLTDEAFDAYVEEISMFLDGIGRGHY